MKKRIKIYCPNITSQADHIKHLVRPGIENSEKCESVSEHEDHDVIFVGHALTNPGDVLNVVRTARDKRPGIPVINIDYVDLPADIMCSYPQLKGIDNVFNFKRSMVDSKLKKINSFTHHIAHAPFCVRDDIHEQQNKLYKPYKNRKYTVSTFFPENDGVTEGIVKYSSQPEHIIWKNSDARLYVASVVILCDYDKHIGFTASINNSIERPGGRGRSGVNIDVKGSMQYNYCDICTDSKIIVTAQPTPHEGDWRLMEAMTSGALVMHNEMVLPPAGLIDGKHWVLYNSMKDLSDKIEYYANRPGEALKIANTGKDFVENNYRAEHLVEGWLKIAGLL